MVKRFVTLVLVSFFPLILNGCYSSRPGESSNTLHSNMPVAEGEKPPPWAPADRNHAKHVYKYYTSGNIYYDTGSGIYFYYRDGSWHKSEYIPAGLSHNIHSFVTINMDAERPYMYHDEVQKRYPAGQ